MFSTIAHWLVKNYRTDVITNDLDEVSNSIQIHKISRHLSVFAREREKKKHIPLAPNVSCSQRSSRTYISSIELNEFFFFEKKNEQMNRIKFYKDRKASRQIPYDSLVKVSSLPVNW